MRWSFLAAGLITIVLSASGTATACTYEWDTDSTSSRDFGVDCYWGLVEVPPAGCIVQALCTKDAPSQVVDRAQHCVGRASSNYDDVVDWVPEFTHWYADFYTGYAATTASDTVNSQQQPEYTLNYVLCNYVASQFCTDPVDISLCMPVADPLGARPPWE